MHEIGLSVAFLDGVLVVRGEVDLDTCHVLREAIAEHTVNNRIVIDMSGCLFCDSSCLQSLAYTASMGVTVVVRRPSLAIRRALDVSGVEGLLTIED